MCLCEVITVFAKLSLILFQNSAKMFGVPAKKRQLAKHKMPWEKIEETLEEEFQPLAWNRNPLAAAL